GSCFKLLNIICLFITKHKKRGSNHSNITSPSTKENILFFFIEMLLFSCTPGFAFYFVVNGTRFIGRQIYLETYIYRKLIIRSGIAKTYSQIIFEQRFQADIRS